MFSTPFIVQKATKRHGFHALFKTFCHVPSCKSIGWLALVVDIEIKILDDSFQAFIHV